MHFFLVAAEPSGDTLGGGLIKELKIKAPDSSFTGVGGPQMLQEGQKQLFDLESLSVMGLFSVIKHLPRLIRLFFQIKRQILKENPDHVVLIDYAEFHLFLARSLRKSGYQGEITHYVCPSIWAWRKKRQYSMERTLNRVLCLLPFEPHFFSKGPLCAYFVGHPLVEIFENHKPRMQKGHIGLFPGSRAQEIKRNLPLQLKAASYLSPSKLSVSVARPQLLPLIQSITKKQALPIEYISQEKRIDSMRTMEGALATSGTITLELALATVPTVMVYQIPRVTFTIMLRFFKTILPFYGLPNLMASQELIPEFFSYKICPKEVANTLQKILSKREAWKKRCLDWKKTLPFHHPSKLAAKALLESSNELSLHEQKIL